MLFKITALIMELLQLVHKKYATNSFQLRQNQQRAVTSTLFAINLQIMYQNKSYYLISSTLN